MDVPDYEKLLKRSESVLSKSNQNQQRLKIPEPDVIQEGKVTIVRNFMDIVDMINRDVKHVTKFLMTEFGIGVTVDNKRLIINRKISADQISMKLKQYMESYVFCYECNSPDTEIVKVGRTNVLVCKACGAQHPIKMASEMKMDEETVEEGKQYTVQIAKIGVSGEGRAFYRGFNIFVPGVKKGETVKVLIKKIKNNTAIAEVVDKEKE
ncbi:MAG TPA: translation initiation factor IF-2 subunit beta [Thermoplasmataceae archaeon]|nr:translation initiation factor IF-2 subunit beta [Thermoplasmatales archaeon AK]HLH86082.1 translation initiation factor IF-2 subunit beta [Thermoplasmataceae archaeon]